MEITHGGRTIRSRRALAAVAAAALAGAMLAPAATAADDQRPGTLGTDGRPADAEIATGVGGSPTVPHSFFVELRSEPTILGGRAAAIEADRSRFLSDAEAAAVDVEVTSEFGSLWNGVAVSTAEDNLETLAASPVVEAIYPIAVVEAPETAAVDAQLLAATAMTGADEAQGELGLTGRGVRVGIIDTGVDYDHPDLGGRGSPGGDSFPTARVTHGYDFVGDAYNASIDDLAGYHPYPQPDRDPDDCNGHGTHVAGIVGASGRSTGVAPGVTLGAYRVFGCDGATTSEIMLHAMERALADGMDVVNMSIGAPFASWAEYPTSRAADALVARGVHVAVSVGNSGAFGLQSVSAPGAARDVIAVGAVDRPTDPSGSVVMSSFSSFGSTADLRVKPDVSAPGGQIYAPFPLEAGGYATLSGTSMAAPHVAGAVALMLEDEPTLQPKEARTRLQNTATPVRWRVDPAALEVVHRQGAGLVQVDDAVLSGTRVRPGLVQLGQVPTGSTQTASVTVHNASSRSRTYTVSTEEAVETAGTKDPVVYYRPSQTVVAPATLTVPAGGRATLAFTVRAPAEATTRFGGFVALTDQLGGRTRVAYGGYAGDLQDERLVTDAGLHRTVACANVVGPNCYDPEGSWARVKPGHVFTMQDGDFPTLAFSFDHQVRAMTWDVYRAGSDGSRGALVGRARSVDHLARSVGLTREAWDGTVQTSTGGYAPVPDGSYIVEARFTKARAFNDDRPARTETWATPHLRIARGQDASLSPEVSRVLGEDRYQVASTIAMDHWEAGRAGTVYIASGLVFPDALAGSAVAGHQGAPVLLTRADRIPAPTAAALDALEPDRIVILGGEGTVQPQVATALRQFAPAVSRVGGADRYAVAGNLAAQYPAGLDTVFLASGEVFPDALSASALAAHQGAPLLLTRGGRLSAEAAAQIERIGPDLVVVVGGPATVSDTVLGQVEALGPDTDRVGGSDRYAVSAAVASMFEAPVARSYMASGLVFSDALTISPVAAVNGGPVHLTRPARVPAAVRDSLLDLTPRWITVAGGYGSVSLEVQTSLEALRYR